MIRSSSFIFSMLLAVGASGLLYHTSYAVQADERRLAAINDDIARTQDAIRVLRAEQAYLEAPARIERLARADLKMGPLDTARQVKGMKQFLSTPTDSAPQLVADATPTAHAQAAHTQFAPRADRRPTRHVASMAPHKATFAPRMMLAADQVPNDPLQNLIAKIGQ